MTPKELLRHHVTGAIERGEAEPIIEQTAKPQAHSPLPWTYSAIGGDNFIMSKGVPVAEVLYDEAKERITIEQMDANKALIVASVNHAAQLAEALRELINITPYSGTLAAREAIAAWEAAQ